MQKTIVLEYKGEKVASQPFTFRHACIVDDERFKGGGIATGARMALMKMFEGTVITDEVIDNMEPGVRELKAATKKILDWYLGIDDDVKNS